jgi:SAM-dependent methyltransferase
MTASINDLYRLGVPHNGYAMPLPDGTFFPDYLDSIRFDERPTECLAQFDRVRDRDWEACTFLDLGCSEGSTTFGLSQTGATVFGVEGRADGIERAKALREILKFDRTHFAVGNVDHDSSYRDVDGIFNAGVLYHLEDPIACLERCAKHARLFVYLDTHHVPRSDEERDYSPLRQRFGQSRRIEAHGVTLEALDVLDSKQKEEIANGLRRAPRSGIGNSNATWLAHRDVVALMAILGFPHHAVLADKPATARVRTAFFRNAPRPLAELAALARPIPQAASPDVAIRNTRQRDLTYLRGQGRPVVVVGQQPLLDATVADHAAVALRFPTSSPCPMARSAGPHLPRDWQGIPASSCSQ